MDDRENNESSVQSTDSDYSQFFGKAKDVVNRYTHCDLCGGNLHFTHSTDFTRNLTQETAKCPECGVQVRAVLHRLQ